MSSQQICQLSGVCHSPLLVFVSGVAVFQLRLRVRKTYCRKALIGGLVSHQVAPVVVVRPELVSTLSVALVKYHMVILLRSIQTEIVCSQFIAFCEGKRLKHIKATIKAVLLIASMSIRDINLMASLVMTRY